MPLLNATSAANACFIARMSWSFSGRSAASRRRRNRRRAARALGQPGEHARHTLGFLVGHGREIGEIAPPVGVARVGLQRFLHHDDAFAVRQFVDGERDGENGPHVEVVPQGIDCQRRRPGINQEISPEIGRAIAPEMIADVDARDDLQPLLPQQPVRFTDGSLEIQVDDDSPSIVVHGSAPRAVVLGLQRYQGARTLPDAPEVMMVAALQITCGGPWFVPAARPSIEADAQSLTGFRQWPYLLPADVPVASSLRIVLPGSSYAVVMDQPGSWF